MQPLKSKPVSFGRVRRHRKEHEGENFSWAVSYSDLLMVLMSFFIVLLQLEPGTSGPSDAQSVLSAIKNEFSRTSVASMPSVVPTGATTTGVATTGITATGVATTRTITATTGGGTGIKTGFQQITTALAEQNIVYVENSKEGFLTVELESNLYGKGQVELSPQAEGELESVFKVLEPHLATIGIVVVGHSDSISVAQSRDRPNYLNSNLAFSSLRALIGSQYLTQLGVSPDQIKIEATDSFQRNTRSLSVKVYWKGAKK